MVEVCLEDRRSSHESSRAENKYFVLRREVLNKDFAPRYTLLVQLPNELGESLGRGNHFFVVDGDPVIGKLLKKLLAPLLKVEGVIAMAFEFLYYRRAHFESSLKRRVLAYSIG